MSLVGQIWTSQYDPLDFVIPEKIVDLSRKKIFRSISFIGHIPDDCMRRCIYCNIQKRSTCELTPFPLKLWKEIVQECSELGIVGAVLGGGDPFMHRYSTRIIHWFIENGIHPFVSTKSLVSKRIASEIYNIGLQNIQVSIDAPFPELADSMVGTPHYYSQVIQSITNLIEAGIKVRINTVVTNRNYRVVPKLIRLLSELGVSSIGLSQMGVSMYYLVPIKENGWKIE